MDFSLYIRCYQQVVDQASEEAVLMKILQVLLKCVKGGRDGSVGLDDHHVCTAVNTCFRVVHQAGGKSELLQRFSRNAMQELVRRVFARLPLVGLEQASDANSVKQEVFNKYFYRAVSI
jgi:golgi-specific brefeldin A-resistance guanine nucleotide exchange factor 1